MNPHDASRKYLKELKGQPLKKKLEHIFTYYWIPIVIVLSLVFFLSWYITEQVTRKDSALFGYCINGAHVGELDDPTVEKFADKYIEFAGIDTEESEVTFIDNFFILYDQYDESTYNNIQSLFAHIAAEQVDFTVSGRDVFMGFSYSDTYMDLRTVLTPEQYQKIEPILLYVDRAILESEDESAIDNLITNMDPADPSTMSDPIPVGIMIPEDSIFREYYSFTTTDLVFGIIKNTQQLDNALKLLEMILA